jgi:hypothetical protein
MGFCSVGREINQMAGNVVLRNRIDDLRREVGIDDAGRLLAPPLLPGDRAAIERLAFRRMRSHWRLLAEVLTLEYLLARRRSPDLDVATFLDRQRAPLA